MKTTEFSSALLQERYVCMEHPSGLPIYVFPKKLTSYYAFFATRYGSVDSCFAVSPREKPITVPDGVAHFLEHKLFENEDGSDSCRYFASLGADVNAFTSYNRTAYFFGCTEHFDLALEELLRFVTRPYFTDATVQKEQGIIAQEIREYEDNPWEQCFQNMLEAMYSAHPVRNNICGSEASIARITPALLYDCHRVFYHPANMALVVCGDVTPEEVYAVADSVLPKERTPSQIRRSLPRERKSVRRPFVSAEMQVSKPVFSIGVKDPFVPDDPMERLRRDTALSLLDEILFSRSGEFYNKLFESNMVSPGFSGGYSSAQGFGFHCFSGEADDPRAVLKAMRAYLRQVQRDGIDEETFNRCKRVMYADELRAYDSTEEIAHRLLSFVFDDVEMFSYPEVLQSIQKRDLEILLSECFKREYFTLSVAEPFSNES